MGPLRRRQAIRLQSVYMVVVLIVLGTFGRLSLPLFLTAALVGLVVLAETARRPHADPPWVRRLRRSAAVGLGLFALYLLVRMRGMLPASAA